MGKPKKESLLHHHKIYLLLLERRIISCFSLFFYTLLSLLPVFFMSSWSFLFLFLSYSILSNRVFLGLPLFLFYHSFHYSVWIHSIYISESIQFSVFELSLIGLCCTISSICVFSYFIKFCFPCNSSEQFHFHSNNFGSCCLVLPTIHCYKVFL